MNAREYKAQYLCNSNNMIIIHVLTVILNLDAVSKGLGGSHAKHD